MTTRYASLFGGRETGLVDAQLAAPLIKQEVARPGEGRRTACRTIIAMRRGADLVVVMHVFAKSEKANLTRRETDAYLELSKSIVDLTSGSDRRAYSVAGLEKDRR